MNYTPGPWVARPLRTGGWVDITAIHSNSPLIANARFENTEANGLLIAAAPDLIEALISLVAVARDWLPGNDQHPEVKKADAALKKAWGAK